MRLDYSEFHKNPTNLLIHLITVPLFVLFFVAAVWMLLKGNVVAGILLLLGPMLSLAAQSYGHKREAVPPLPFTGAGNFIRRIMTEQFFGFWIFLFSGDCLRAMRASARKDAD